MTRDRVIEVLEEYFVISEVDADSMVRYIEWVKGRKDRMIGMEMEAAHG